MRCRTAIHAAVEHSKGGGPTRIEKVRDQIIPQQKSGEVGIDALMRLLSTLYNKVCR